MLKRRLKPVYLLFLAIPLLYFLLWNQNTKPSIPEALESAYVNFSVKTSTPLSLTLLQSKDSIYSWSLTSGGFKDLEFLGTISDSTPLSIRINGLNSGDSLTFLGFNLFHHGLMKSLIQNLKKNISIENGAFVEKDGSLTCIGQQANKPMVITLSPFASWESPNNGNPFLVWFILGFALVLVLIIVFAPPIRYFIVTMIICLTVMIVGHNTDQQPAGYVQISNDSPIKRPEVFYRNTPFFSPAQKYNCDSLTRCYCVPIIPEKAPFLRFDVGDSITSLQHLSIEISTGFFHNVYDLSALSQDRLILNDLTLKGNIYYVTGQDPYIKLTSSYFLRQLQLLIFLEHNLILFITLIVFLILIAVHRWMRGPKQLLSKLKFRPSYLFFLLLPASYFLIENIQTNNVHHTNPDQLFFSARSSKPSQIILYNGNDSVTSWDLNSSAYKYFQYAGPINKSSNLWLKVNKLAEGDTLSLLSCNLFQEGQTYSLYDKDAPWSKMKNVTFGENHDECYAIVKHTNMPVIIELKPFDLIQKGRPGLYIVSIIIIVFLLVFLIILVLGPKPKYLIVVSIVSSLLMFIFFWLCRDLQDQVILSNKSPVKSVQFYYSNNPTFIPEQIVSTDKGICTFKANIDLITFPYLRCDVLENTKELEDLSLSTKTGVLKKSWDYSTTPSSKLLVNDMVRHGNIWYVRGSDPYFVLTSEYQLDSIQWLTLVKQTIFLMLTLVCFLLLLALHRVAIKQDAVVFFTSVFFLIFISYGLILHFFSSEGIVLSAERRYTNPRPTAQIDSTMVFVKQLDDYIKDQIPGRNNIVIMNNLIEYSTFGELLNNPNVHFGKDGWMFYIGGICRENYENRTPLTQEELIKMKTVLMARKNWLKERGIQFYLVFPVMSYVIYEEKVGPRLWRYHKPSKLDQLLTYLHAETDLDIIDIQTPLMEAKKGGYMDLYYKSNTHWSHYGGYVAYCAMIEEIRKDFPEIGPPMQLKDIEWVKFDVYSPDLYVLSALDKFVDCYEVKPFNAKLKASAETTHPYYPELTSPAPAYCFHNNSISKNPNVLMYGDSFGGFLLYYLTYNFSHTYYLFTPTFYPTIIEKEKPEIVIQEMADYTIYRILNENPPLPALKDSIVDTED